MGKLTEGQRKKVREVLRDQGLTFKPLLEEMVDHISCDLEERMSEKYSFNEAWHLCMNEIPNNHFQILQQETMETINRRFTLFQALSYLALALLFGSLTFKLFHLQFAGELLLLSFGAIAASLLTGSLSGIFLNKEKKGAIRVLAVIVGVIVLLTGYAFSISHMPGADELKFLGVALLVISLVVNTLYVYQRASGEGNLLTFLHEKYTPGIERFFLLLLFPLVIYKVIAILTKPEDFLGNLILLVVILGSGLQFIALNWRIMEKDLTKRNGLILTAIIISFLCFMLPFLGEYLAFEIRVVMITLCTLVTGWLAYRMEDSPKKMTDLVMVILLPVLFFGWALIRLEVIPSSNTWIFFNLPVLLILVAGLLSCRKHGAMRAYMMMSLSGYLFEYPL
ncbi:MAG TPA: hypothetical protein VK625_11145 [Flavitalea sp.]|nr:hypothetical protein [Flavitalea sp.]